MRSGTARRSRRSLLPRQQTAAEQSPNQNISSLSSGACLDVGPSSGVASAARPAPRHLWLAVHLPALPLECLRLAATPNASKETSKNTQPVEYKEIELPKVIIDGEGATAEVMAVDALAARLGIQPGHGLTAAYALAARLEALPRQPGLERQALQRLARLATQFSPWVSLEPPDALLLEVRGSLRLLGGSRNLLARWRQALAREGLTASLALTPTPLSALWCARAAVPGAPVRALTAWGALAAAVAALPLSVTRWSPVLRERMAEAGLRQVGEVLRLPREGLARRYGPQLAEELEQVMGHRPAPRARTVLPERFVDGMEFEAEATSIAGLWPAAESLLQALERFLRSRGAGVSGIVLQLRHRPSGLLADDREGCPSPRLTTVSLGLAAPAAAAERLGLLLRERLERLPLPAPVCGVRLRSGVLVPLHPESGQLPGTIADSPPGAAEALLDRLRARLGEETVQGVCLVPEHRPEAAWRRTRPHLQPRPEVVPADHSPPRPLWLLPVPQRLMVRQGQPWHEGALTAESGPERLETGWWDGAEIQRDYYIVLRTDGVRLWIYRERGEVEPGSWWLHGVFG